MNTESLLGLVQNAALLLAAAFIFDVAAVRRRTEQSSFRRALLGLTLGAIGITVMLTPWTFVPGIVFDTRSVLLGISGLFFGPLSTAIAMAMTASLRFAQGGAGAWTGIAVILISGVIGIVWRRLRRPPLHEISWRELYLFGVVIHLAMLATMLMLPWGTALRVLSNIALPVLAIYPLGTALVGVLMVNRLRHEGTEEALRESEERYRNLFENAAEAIFVAQDGRFVFLNPMTAMMTGYSHAELMMRSFAEFIHHDDRDMVVGRHVRRTKGEELPHIYSFRIIRRDGSVRWVELNAILIDWKGRKATLNFLSDITERKEAEEKNRTLGERLQRAEKMEALGQLAGGVAHDLNNVLGILSGYAELVLEEIPEGHRSRGHVEKILQSTERGAAIIQDLLTLARRGVTAAEVINLNSVVSGFLKTPVFEKLRDYHPRVTFRTECDGNLLNIKGSLVHLEKTLMNLVSNGAEAISGEGEVTIRTESRYLDKAVRGYDEVKEGDYAVLTVSDTGMGIPAENIEKIFEPFYTKKPMGRSGTGLGLAIVWGTVKDHQGYIDVRTGVGAGSTFTLYFPVTREELNVRQQKVAPERYRGNGESVLVVDDIAEQRDVAASLLKRLGYEVQSVSSGEEAVEYLRENRADILVLDMIMPPGMDGLETYRRVREIRPAQKAILVSGFSETERVKEAQRLGAGPYVKKPYLMEMIGIAIREELSKVSTGIAEVFHSPRVCTGAERETPE